MKVRAYKFKQFTIAGLIALCTYAGAQTKNADSLSMQVSQLVLIPDTAKATKGNQTLGFALNVKEVDGLRSFIVEISDKDGRALFNLGEYYVKKHQRGFYYVEKGNDKRTIYNGTIYFTYPVKASDLSQIKEVRLSYRSTSDKIKTTAAVLADR